MSVIRVLCARAALRSAWPDNSPTEWVCVPVNNTVGAVVGPLASVLCIAGLAACQHAAINTTWPAVEVKGRASVS